MRQSFGKRPGISACDSTVRGTLALLPGPRNDGGMGVYCAHAITQVGMGRCMGGRGPDSPPMMRMVHHLKLHL